MTARVTADMLAFSKFWYYGAPMQNRSFCAPERHGSPASAALSMSSGSGGLPLRGQIALPDQVEGFLDAAIGHKQEIHRHVP